MAMKVTLSLDETVYERARLLAQLQDQDIAKALASWLEETLPSAKQSNVGNSEANAPDEGDIEQEMQAYIALHPQLVQQHKNQYVAIYGGQLVDYDNDYGALLARVEAAYPNRFIWTTKVTDQPIRQLVFHSPRLTKDG